MATKLQAVSATINAGLEKSMVEIMVSVPRVVTEVDRVEAAIKTLNGELINLSGQVRDTFSYVIIMTQDTTPPGWTLKGRFLPRGGVPKKAALKSSHRELFGPLSFHVCILFVD